MGRGKTADVWLRAVATALVVAIVGSARAVAAEVPAVGFVGAGLPWQTGSLEDVNRPIGWEVDFGGVRPMQGSRFAATTGIEFLRFGAQPSGIVAKGSGDSILTTSPSKYVLLRAGVRWYPRRAARTLPYVEGGITLGGASLEFETHGAVDSLVSHGTVIAGGAYFTAGLMRARSPGTGWFAELRTLGLGSENDISSVVLSARIGIAFGRIAPESDEP